MASCYDCIHFNPCNSDKEIILEKPTEGNDWRLHNKVENECKHFKPAADVVEVVRCKDCKKRYVPYYCALWHSTVNGSELFLERGDSFFCSHGERNDD